jgi:hypothetical protein
MRALKFESQDDDAKSRSVYAQRARQDPSYKARKEGRKETDPHHQDHNYLTSNSHLTYTTMAAWVAAAEYVIEVYNSVAPYITKDKASHAYSQSDAAKQGQKVRESIAAAEKERVELKNHHVDSVKGVYDWWKNTAAPLIKTR